MDITVYTVATLPPAAGLPGTILLVSDATQNPSNNSGVVATGGGTTRTRVLSDGSSWRVFGHSRKGGGSGFGGNLITQQDLSNAYWTLSGYTVASPNSIRETAASTPHTFGMAVGLTRTIGTGIYTHTVDLIKVGADQRFLAVGIYAIGLGSGGARYFDILNGTITSSLAYGGFVITGSSIVAISGGYRCSVTVDCTGSGLAGVIVLEQETSPLGTFTFLGDVTDGYTVSNMTLVQIG